MSKAQVPTSPYVGLVPFKETDAEFFFAREKDTRLIIANLFGAPLTLLYGKSGVGKSSVLNAGVAHEIKQRDDIRAVVFKDWEKNPLEELKRTIDETLIPWLPETDEAPASSGGTLSEILVGWVSALGCRLAIILDQFEDYLQYHPQKHPFAEEFSAAVMQMEAPISFLISIREDSLARLDRFEGTIPVLFDNYLRLEPLNREAGQMAIEKPIERYNERYVSDGPPYSIEASLTKAVLEQVRTGELALGTARGKLEKIESRKYQLDTVYLQLVMTRLWDEELKSGSRVLRRSTLDKLQGARKIVRTYLDQIMNTLTQEEQEIAAAVFRYLVSPSGTKVAYPVHELADYERLNKKQLSVVLNKLSQAGRILRQVAPASEESDEPQYEIFHDALGPAILDWRTRYVRDQEKFKALRQVDSRKQAALKDLERRQRQVRRLIYFSVALGILSFLLGVATLIAFKHRREAESARSDALKQKEEANTQKARAERNFQLLRLKDLAIPYTKSVMSGHTGVITSAAFSPDNTLVVTGSEDKTAKVWDVNDGSLVFDLVGHGGKINDVTFSPDGKYIATASDDHTAHLWDASNGLSKVVMRGHTASVTSVRFSPNSQRIITSSADKTARIWMVGETSSQATLTGHGGIVYTAEFHPQRNVVLTASSDHTARLWDADSGKEIFKLALHGDEVNSARFSASGNSLVTASKDRTARTWDANTGKFQNILSGHTDSVNYAEFDRDGMYIVTASPDGTARIWTSARGELHKILAGHQGRVNTAKFSPDGQRVVTASDDKTARIWDVKAPSTDPLIVLRGGHLNEVNSAAFSYDNQMVLTASNDQTARVWDVSQFGGFKVSKAEADPVNISTPCPTIIRLSGRIEVTEGKGIVFYKFAWGRNQSTRPQRLIVTSPGQLNVTASLRLATPNSSLSEKLYLQILEPNQTVSDQVLLRVRCRAIPAGSPTPPEAPATEPTP